MTISHKLAKKNEQKRSLHGSKDERDDDIENRNTGQPKQPGNPKRREVRWRTSDGAVNSEARSLEVGEQRGWQKKIGLARSP